MNRIDSGFADTVLQHANTEPATIHRSNTAPTRHRKPRRNPSDTTAPVQLANMDSTRATSEKREKPSRQKSTTSSNTSANQSKHRGHGSKPSSRRTSCTIVDPSRPARHYRVKSTHTVSSANGKDIDDVLALHFRSCSIFTNPSYQTTTGLPSPTMSRGESPSLRGGPSRFNSMDIAHAESPAAIYQHSEETIATPSYPATTMHWTSPSTRKRDYERIDRANSGLRGLVRRVLPRCVSGPQEKFYEKDNSDAGSVRRYRLDSAEDDIADEKASRVQSRTRAVPGKSAKKKWLCF